MAKSIETIRASLANDLVLAEELARLDEREKTNAQWKAYLAELETSYAKRTKAMNERIDSLFADRNGEKTNAQPVKVRNLGSGHYRIIRELQKGFTAWPTLMGLTGYSRSTVATYMKEIRHHGYVIKTRPNLSGNSKFRKLYKIAS
jgi:biotin operon repressor